MIRSLVEKELKPHTVRNYQEWYQFLDKNYPDTLKRHKETAEDNGESLEQLFDNTIAKKKNKEGDILVEMALLPNRLLLEAYNKMRELAYLCDFKDDPSLAKWLRGGRKGECSSCTFGG